jgi:hypothetical protein
MRLLIMSDGTPSGTRVTDEFHKPIEGVTAIKFEQILGEAPVITLTFKGGVHSGLMAAMPEAESATGYQPHGGEFLGDGHPPVGDSNVQEPPPEKKPRRVRRKQS